MHCIPVTLMWIYSRNPSSSSDSTIEQPGIATLVAVLCVAILAAAQSHDALLQNTVKPLYHTALICLMLHGVFVIVVLHFNVVFEKWSVLKTFKTDDDTLWTSSDVAITSAICAMLAAPAAHDTGKWLYESIFTQMWFTLLVLLIHWYVFKNDLQPTILALSTLQLASNVCLSSKKNAIWD